MKSNSLLSPFQEYFNKETLKISEKLAKELLNLGHLIYFNNLKLIKKNKRKHKVVYKSLMYAYDGRKYSETKNSLLMFCKKKEVKI